MTATEYPITVNCSEGGSFSYIGSEVAPRITVLAKGRLGYTFLGWYSSSGKLLSTDREYSLLANRPNITLNGEWQISDEMADFDFTSTETTCEIIPKLPYLARVPNHVLTDLAAENFRLIGCNLAPEVLRPTNGSTDVGNVSLVVPTVNISVEYFDAPGHSELWVENGKSEWAENCLLRSAKMLAATAYDLICDPELVRKAQEEFRATVGE